MIEQKEFLETIELMELNYGKKIPNKIIKIWYDEFQEYNKQVFYECVIEAIKNEIFFPTINQVKSFKQKVEEKNQKYDTRCFLEDEDGKVFKYDAQGVRHYV